MEESTRDICESTKAMRVKLNIFIVDLEQFFIILTCKSIKFQAVFSNLFWAPSEHRLTLKYVRFT